MRFNVKLFNVPPPDAANVLVADIVPVPPILKSEVLVPTNLLLFELVKLPFTVNVLFAPIPTKPNGAVPPAKVMVPVVVTEELSVTEGEATEPLKVFEKFKLFTVAGNKLPVTCATAALKVKLVLLFTPLVRFNVPVKPAGNTPLIPAAFATNMVAPASIFNVPLPLAADVTVAVPVVTNELAAILITPPEPKI